jgi:SAM-dependent methyltransferase
MHFVDLVSSRSALQKKAIRTFLSNQDTEYWQSAEQFAEGLLEFLDGKRIEPGFVADAYLKMCKDMLTQQIAFKRTGAYSCSHSSEAYEQVYSSEEEMSSYMYGLALSQYLWPNHYALFRYFQEACSGIDGVRSYLEIGPGHGLYLLEAMRLFPDAEFSAVDISPVSLRISQELVSHFAHGRSCSFRVQDAREITSETYDFISMCEVLEHLDETLPLLKKLHGMTATGGRVFITTCANCPAIDHTYLYDSVAHMRRELQDAGFHILQDLPLAVGDVPEELWEAQKVEVNYAALLARAEDTPNG